MIKPICPHCDIPLQRKSNNGIFQYRCTNCMGFAVNVEALKKVLTPVEVSQLWRASETAVTGNIPCSHCREKMKVLLHGPETFHSELDICRRCRLVWMDTGEWSDLHTRAGSKAAIQPELENIDYRAYANALLEFEKERMDFAKTYTAERVAPPSVWKAAAALLRLPVEEDNDVFQATPWVTWTLILICIAATGWTLKTDLNSAWAMKHLAYSAQFGFFGQLLTGITSFFVHGSWMHLIGNMYALWIFGDNIEDHIGKWQYLFLVFAATMGGHMAFAMFDPRAALLPSVGASGGIFGLIAFYLIQFPQRRFIIHFFFRFLAIPAWLFGAFFIGFKEFLGALVQISGATNVSHLAHLGGALVGVAFCFFPRVSNKRITSVD